MLRPWLPILALNLVLILVWTWFPELIVWAGGLLLAAALLLPLWRRLRRPARKPSPLERAQALDWKIIDNSMARGRLAQDCERQETLGICTGRECLVYDSCSFNIKKVGL